MIAGDTATRVLSVAMKDRSAILPVGRSREEVYWWSTLGFFTTSRYYRDSLPSWVQGWNRRDPSRSLASRVWNLTMAESAYTERDSLPAEKGLDGRQTFPHALPADPAGAAAQLSHFPWMDSLTLDLALTGVSALGGIGEGPAPTYCRSRCRRGRDRARLRPRFPGTARHAATARRRTSAGSSIRSPRRCRAGAPSS